MLALIPGHQEEWLHTGLTAVVFVCHAGLLQHAAVGSLHLAVLPPHQRALELIRTAHSALSVTDG
jgi:hypothetical protein